jgi:hypothetical protein
MNIVFAEFFCRLALMWLHPGYIAPKQRMLPG